MKKWLAIVTFWVLVFIASAELLLRWQGDLQTYSEKLSGKYVSPYTPERTYTSHLHLCEMCGSRVETDEFQFSIECNKEQVRDVTHPLNKPEGTLRIVILGDSFVEGWGVAFNNVWHQLLKDNVNQQSNSLQINILAGGVTGSDPLFAYQLLVKRLLKYQPDMVWVTMNRTDLVDNAHIGGWERFTSDETIQFRKGPPYEWWFQHSYLVRFVMMRIVGHNWLMIGPQEERKRKAEAVQSLIETAQKFENLSKTNGFQLTILFHPLMEDLWAQVYPNEIQQVQDSILKDSIHSIDLLPFFIMKTDIQEFDDLYPYYYPIDHHHTVLGNALFAEAVEAALKKSGLLDKYLPADTITR